MKRLRKRLCAALLLILGLLSSPGCGPSGPTGEAARITKLIEEELSLGAEGASVRVFMEKQKWSVSHSAELGLYQTNLPMGGMRGHSIFIQFRMDAENRLERYSVKDIYKSLF